eukprot:g15813.t1
MEHRDLLYNENAIGNMEVEEPPGGGGSELSRIPPMVRRAASKDNVQAKNLAEDESWVAAGAHRRRICLADDLVDEDEARELAELQSRTAGQHQHKIGSKKDALDSGRLLSRYSYAIKQEFSGPELAASVKSVVDDLRELWNSEGAVSAARTKKLHRGIWYNSQSSQDEKWWHDAGRQWVSFQFGTLHKILVNDIRGLAVMKQIAAPVGHVLAVEEINNMKGRSSHCHDAMSDEDVPVRLQLQLLGQALGRIARFYEESMSEAATLDEVLQEESDLEQPWMGGFFGGHWGSPTPSPAKKSALAEYFPAALVYAYQKMYDAALTISRRGLRHAGAGGLDAGAGLPSPFGSTSFATPRCERNLPCRMRADWMIIQIVLLGKPSFAI